jgi:hypothetical protein
MKVADAIQDAIGKLTQYQPQIRNPGKLKEINAAIESGTARVNSMRPALDKWNTRVTDHPGVWNSDGTSKVQPGWPSETSIK